jgi:hypothetical protein
MMHNELINYNCVIDSVIDSIMEKITRDMMEKHNLLVDLKQLEELNVLVGYNISAEDSKMKDHNLLVGIIQDEIKKQMNGVPGVAKRQSHIDNAERRRPESMNELETQNMSVMYSSENFIHHFILYRMDDGRIADVYIKLTVDKNVDVFEYSVV